MGKTLYLECNSGISGDMTVGALLDLGADRNVLDSVLKTVKAEGFTIKYSRVKRSGLDCQDFDVVLDEEHDGHDHDMEYLYGHTHSHEAEHMHHNHHDHTAQHDEHHHNHHHIHRGMKEITEIIDNAEMTDNAKSKAKRIFEILAVAESKAHGVPVEEVHFHEVGAVDSIVDVISIAVCVDNLDIDKVIVPKLYEGHGTVRCQHGILPVPVPAVTNIVTEHKISLEIIDVKGELVTPTGAAAVAALRTDDKLPKEFKIEKVGMGSGKRDYGLAGFVRAMIIS
ncbi:LarC family nickel insertion protein [Pseudobutyrivibrio sp.]|uniref:LarC family nickel insertion protein n=1 Tax=Pseudobutyrivibrio sp. TaxID=2014367 RepID=UPI001B224196|nr:LarC family nickel insertion protein [Pseudobutyrivibrio sp.]MBO5618145.1 LarC family nickel insertion protein [Pseudobutyrivibrio sp.]MBP3261391.1 LarC family nickel insertion protein [Pseudobutyrivibrio sp.]